MRDFGHRIGDDAEIYFYLYDGHNNRMRPLSERFLVRISKEGFSNYIEKLHSNCSVFTDLGKHFFFYFLKPFLNSQFAFRYFGNK